MPTTRTLQSKRILDYLQQMIDYSRHCHRHDLVTLYEDSWLTAAEHIYGRLPTRFPMKGYPPGPASVTAPDSRAAGILSASPTPQWRLEMLSRPWRRIVARDGDYEVLDCGHRCWHIHVPGLSKPRKRRCRECPPEEHAQNKKPVAAVPADKAKAARA